MVRALTPFEFQGTMTLGAPHPPWVNIYDGNFAENAGSDAHGLTSSWIQSPSLPRS